MEQLRASLSEVASMLSLGLLTIQEVRPPHERLALAAVSPENAYHQVFVHTVQCINFM